MSGAPARRIVRGSPRPPDKLHPYMPSVDTAPDLPPLLAGARQLCAAPPHPFVVLTPARELVPVPSPAPGEEARRLSRELLGTTEPIDLVVVAYTEVEALRLDLHRAIPFAGLLGALASVGHRVVVFEGHPAAFAAGVADADVLLVDGAMVPFVQFDWRQVAFERMRRPSRVLVHDRRSFNLLEAAPPVARGSDFGPRIPPVRDGARLPSALREARQLAATPEPHQIAVIAPERRVFGLACPRFETLSRATVDLVMRIAPGEPYDVAVIACNDERLLREDLRRAFPTVDLVLAMGACHHNVVLFEGHPDALLDVLRDTRILIVDGAFEPLLPPDWAAQAAAVMFRSRIVVVTRDGIPLLWSTSGADSALSS